MSDEPQSDRQEMVLVDQNFDNRRSGYKNYSAEDKFTVLAAYDIMGANIYRVAIAYGVPYSTLYGWVKEREARGGGPSKLEREKRGSLAAKLEDKVHSVVESITPEVIGKASLAQRGVFIGIGLDKLRILRSEELEPDPAVVLCQILGITREQLPDSLRLEPGEEVPEDFLSLIEVVPEKRSEETRNPSPAADACTTEGDRKLLHPNNEDESAN